MADYAHEETERQLKELEARIERIYADAAMEMMKTVDDYWESFQVRDEKERQRYKDGEITQEQYYQWRLNQEGRGERYEKMVDNLAERYDEANEVAVAYVNDATPSIYSLNRNFEAYEIESSGADIAFDIWDEQTVKRLIIEDPDLMPNYPEEKAIKRGIDLAYGRQQITASVTSGILQGKSVTKIADDLMKRITTMSRTSAVRTARTAFTQAQNAGRQDTMEAAEEMGIKMEKVWLATLDGNTRPEHAEADGQRVGVKDDFIVGGEKLEYPGDRAGSPWNVYNCRCTMVSVPEGMDLNNTQRWARDPVTGERSLVSNMTYKDWYEWRTKGANMSYEDFQASKNNPSFTSTDESANIITAEPVREFKSLLSDFDVNTYEGKYAAMDYWESELASKNITDEEYNMIYGWNGYIGTGNSFEINEALRNNGGDVVTANLSEHNKEVVTTLRDVIAKNEFPQDTLAVRYVDANAIENDFGISMKVVREICQSSSGIPDDINEDLSPLIGTTIKEEQFVSVSGDERLNVFRNRPIKMEMEIPEGTHAYLTTNSEESEAVMDEPSYTILGFDRGLNPRGEGQFIIRIGVS